MFSKKHLVFVSNFEEEFLYRSCVVKYSLFEDNIEERNKRLDLYNSFQIQDDHSVRYTIEKSLKKEAPTPVYYIMRIIEKKKIARFEKTMLLFHEHQTRKAIRHNFLINFIDSFQDKKNLYYITDFAKSGFLFFYLRRKRTLPKHQAVFYIAEIILAIQYLHSKGLLYRSLFPSNILLSYEGHIKLKFDFLNKQGLDPEKIEANIQYIPYDFIKYNTLSQASDYWGIGVVLYEMILGHPPFSGKTAEETKYNILNSPLYLPHEIDQDIRNLLTLLLDRDRNRRSNRFRNPNFIKSLPLFDNIDWNLLEKQKIKLPLDFNHEINHDQERPIDRMFDSDYRANETDGYANTFKYYQDGQFKRFGPW